MKVFIKSYLSLAVLVTVCIVSCKKSKKVEPQNVLPAPVNTIISASELAKLQKYGTIVNEGTNPPDITGVFLLQPDLCVFDNSTDSLRGQLFDDYYYKFSKQNNQNFTVRVDFENTADSTDLGSDTTATFISGNSNLFTVFAQSKATEYGVNYTSLDVVSGQIGSTGIKNLQVTKYLQSKGADPNGLLADVGTTRIFYDPDYLSDRETNTVLGLIKNSTQLKTRARPTHLARRIQH